MPQIPRDPAFDNTLALLSDGYAFIAKRCARYRTDLFETRIMMQRVVCMLGADAARIFYDGDRFTRKRAVPAPTLTLLQDRGSVQLLDGAAHLDRKRMFMSIMDPAAVGRLVEAAVGEWRRRAPEWRGAGRVVLFDEVEAILCRAVCRWASIPLGDAEAKARTRELSAMIDGAGSVGLRNLRGQLLRARTERWARDLVGKVRSGALAANTGTALDVIARHRDADGNPLELKVAGVELLNVLRPTVAVGRFVIFAALALHEHPESRSRLGDDSYCEWFVQEVRRFYPFFPFVGGRARTSFEWRGHTFHAGDWVLLDLYGTGHDPRLWDDPHVFRPERFRGRSIGPFDLIPQGGGDFLAGHRCPGEPATIELMKGMVQLLAGIDYDVPPQDLSVSLSRFPAVPKSRFVIANARPAGASA